MDKPKRKRASSNPTYRLEPEDRPIIALMVELNLWTKTAIAETFGVTRKTVLVCHQEYY